MTNKALRRVNFFIDAKTGVDVDESNDKITDDENNYLYGFKLADDVTVKLFIICLIC